MKATKLPYKVQFQPQYQTFQQRMGKLPIPPINPNAPITPVDQLIDLIGLKEKIRDDELEFTPSSIYSQYATANILKQGKKNMTELCPGCGQDNKKPIQCQFCAVMYCKNCCWRKRVIPTLSQPKEAHLECEDCHSKYVKLLVNQKFYDESAIFQKIVDSCSGRVKKLQKDIKTKKQRYEAGDKKKKQYKIKQNMLLKELKDQQKKVQALQLKLQEVVNKKAEKLRQEQEKKQKEEEQNKKLEEQFKKQQEEEDIKRREQQNLKRQREIQQNLIRQKQIQNERQAIRKRQEQTRLQIERQQRQMQQQRRKQQEKLQQKRKIEQKKAEQFKNLTMQNLKQILSDSEHKKQTDQLRNLAKAMMKQPQHLDEKSILHTPDIVITTLQVESPIKASEVKKQQEQILFTPVDVINSPLIKNRKSNTSSIQEQKDTDLKTKSKLSSNNDNETATNTDKKQLKGDLTQSTQKAAQNHLELQNSLKTDQKDKQQNPFSKMPEIAIDIAGMTVNQLLGIHVDPYGNQNKRNSLNRRISQRQSYQEQKRASLILDQVDPTPIEKSKSELELTEQQKLSILRSSNVSASLLHSAHSEQEVHAHPDPIDGNKCTCNLM